MDYNDDSVFNLISKLCEKFSNSCPSLPSHNETIARARRKCYQILLSSNSYTDEWKELENNNDPACHLLAWQYTLLSQYNLVDHAQKIKMYYKELQQLNVFEDPVNSNVLMLLLNLRSVPVDEEPIMDRTLNRNINSERNNLGFPFFANSRFHIPNDEIILGVSHIENDLFKIKSEKSLHKMVETQSSTNFVDSPSLVTSASSMNKNSEPSLEYSQDVNIWEFAAMKPLRYHRTWEEYGSVSPKRKLPFLCESGSTNTAVMYKVSSQLNTWLTKNTSENALNMVPLTTFVKDVKYLLVGIITKTFVCDENNVYSIKPGVYVEGLTHGTIKSYVSELIFCGQCYKGLDALCSQNPFTLKENNKGYIFFELCESVKRYLSYYRLAVLSIPNSVLLLMLHQHTKQLRTYIRVLASVCKVGPFAESTQIPHGVALLNYLFQQVMSLTDSNVIMVLYSVLYPCCQVYFSRFLQQWLLHGTIHDPFGEFFINVHSKYVTTRGRTYWTRSYTIREDIVPDFIGDLSSEILLCGKAMNLLKFCIPNSPLCLYIMEKHPEIISCCLTPEQLAVAEHNNHVFYLEATAVCGPRISLSQIISSHKDESRINLDLIAKKQLATLNRIELQRKKETERELKKRNSEMRMLKEQYLEAIRLKQLNQAEELESNIKLIEKNLWVQNLYDEIVHEESTNMIEYYSKLYEVAENRRIYFEKRSETLRRFLLEQHEPQRYIDVETSREKKSATDSETYLSIPDDTTESPSCYAVATNCNGSSVTSSVNYSEELDNINDLNANSVSMTEMSDSVSEVEISIPRVLSSAEENFEIAKRNKLKMMSLEVNLFSDFTSEPKKRVQFDNALLTDAQKNKLKVMSSEMHLNRSATIISLPLSTLEMNRNKMMASDTCFSGRGYGNTNQQHNDNENYVNKNVVVTNLINDNIDKNENVIKKWVSKKQDTLSLDFSKIENCRSDSVVIKKLDIKASKSPKFELDKVSPMSIDSTPLSSIVTTPSNRLLPFEKNDCDSQSVSGLTTGSEVFSAEATSNYQFELDKSKSVLYFENRKSTYNLKTKSMKEPERSISNKNTKMVSTNCLKLYLQQSISVPLTAQIKLVTQELLKYYIQEQHYLKHLHSLRNYFFLLDGEFGRNITDNLFKKLYDVNFPMDLINIHTLTVLVYKAINYSTKLQANSQSLSFRINDLPSTFDLRDPDVFDCISLTYKTSWPLNILLPSDSIAKYDEVFKFLLKLHRISWVLQNIFQDLKLLLKETDFRKSIVMMSPQYRRLHQCRHVLMHFIQTLQTYIVSEVLHSTWEIFENHLKSVINIDQLYALHTTYIKNILFMCLLNQKSAPLQKVLNKIFVVILKFYDYLRSRSWYSIEGVFMHPNFSKLEDIFNNFQELVSFLFKIGQKVVRSGYQPHLLQLLNMLNINGYYSKIR